MKPLITLSACLSSVLVACHQGETSSPQPVASSTQQPASTTKPTYRVSSEQVYEPFVTRNEKGTQDGFEFELLNAIAEKQGFQLTFSSKPWEVLVSDLQTNQSDIISSGITITPERQAKIDFSDPYFETSTALLVGKQSHQIQKFSDIKGKVIAAQWDTVQPKIAKQYGASQVVHSNSTWLTVKATISGTTSATLGDYGSMSYYASRYPQEQLRIIKDPQATPEQLGFGVKKGNRVLLEQLNQGLAQIKADGTYAKIYAKWFGHAN